MLEEEKNQMPNAAISTHCEDEDAENDKKQVIVEQIESNSIEMQVVDDNVVVVDVNQEQEKEAINDKKEEAKEQDNAASPDEDDDDADAQHSQASALPVPVHKRKYWPEDKVLPTENEDDDDDDNSNSNGAAQVGAWCRGNRAVRGVIRCYNCWTYSYMNTILKQGRTLNQGRTTTTTATTQSQPIVQKEEDPDTDDETETYHLTADDLFPVPQTMESRILVQKFEETYRDYQQQQQQQEDDELEAEELGTNKNNNNSNTNNRNRNRSTKRIFLQTLWILARPTYIPAGVYQLISVLCVSTMPLVVRALLLVIEEGNAHATDTGESTTNIRKENSVNVVRAGVLWSLLLTSVALVNGLANQRQRHQAMKTGVAIRSATMNIIYRHLLALSPEGKRGLKSGELNNLVAVDCQRVYEVFQEGHLLWALPLSIGLVTWFLCMVMGPSTLVGVLVLLAFIPIINGITNQMTSVRSQRVRCSDERVDITVSMLMGMRTTKLNGYETKYQTRVQDVREQELKFLLREQFWWASTLLVMVSSPTLATGATFATYVLTSSSSSSSTYAEPNHILTAADTFGVLLLFGALRFPINFFGRLIGRMAQALSAVQRIVLFLERPLRHEEKEEDEQQSPSLLLLRGSDHDSGTCSSTSTTTPLDTVTATEDTPLILSQARFRVGVAPLSFDDTIDDDNSNSNGNNNNNNNHNNSIANSNEQYKSATNNKEQIMTTTKSLELMENGNSNNIIGSDTNNLSFTVGDFDLKLHKGQVLVVCGPVGSGKSTLIHGILDEADSIPLPHSVSSSSKTVDSKSMAVSSSVPIPVHKYGHYSYAPQDPFILNQSIRENILFGDPYNAERYNKVLDACALWPDIQQIGGSDLIQIGERGVTLSGGQRQRISLARAAYKQSSCIILDDPFSALDSGTGRDVFESLIASSSDALLKDRAVLLVSHAPHIISHPAVNTILLIVNGRNQFIGTWEELKQFESNIHDKPTLRAVNHIQSQIRENTKNNEVLGNNRNDTINPRTDSKNRREPNDTSTNESTVNKASDLQRQQQEIANKKIMQKELRQHGLSNAATWLLWFRRAGGIWYVVTVFILLALDRIAYVAVEWFLAMWTSGAYEEVSILGISFEPQIDGIQAQAKYLTVYFSIMAVSILATAARCEFCVTGGVRATKKVFNSMLKSVLRSPLSYFETTPMGQILNRFTYDTDVNDVTLTQSISIFLISISWYVAGIVVMTAIVPWSIFVLVPVTIMYFIILYHYRHTGPDLQRIDCLSRSPVQSILTECLEGTTSIRVFNQKLNFMTKFEDAVNTSSSALLNFVTLQRWLSVRMETLGAIVVLVTSVLMVCLNAKLNISAGLAGLLINWSSNFTITLNFLVDTFSETEAAITAIERVDAMSQLPSEKSLETDMDNVQGESSSSSVATIFSESWPHQGLLEFKNVALRYRDGLPLALNDLSFKVPAGKTCGIVGRTGAGKSSITAALFRLVEVESGRILLDGVDLTTLGLSDVRGRGMSIIPQDPFLAGANLRDCLDPFQKNSDEEIMEALQAVRMGNSSRTTTSTTIATESLLSTKLEEGGSNYSVGERQLLNLARAILTQPKVLVLDEATASIDGETDAFIQKMLRTRFPDTTLLTIAHRLNTIMDYDYVLVMDKGRASEFDSPINLLSKNDDNGIFSQLVDATGAESSKALRQMAIDSSASKAK